MEDKTKLDKLYKALAIGTPIKNALRFAEIPEPLYRIWESQHKAVAYEKLRKKYEDAIEKPEIELPNPDILTRYANSQKYKRVCDEAYSIIEKCLNSQSKAVVKHLNNLMNDGYKMPQIVASQWFLERVLPNEFGKGEREEEVAVKPIEVSFVKPNEDSRKRIEDMERDILGDAKSA